MKLDKGKSEEGKGCKGQEEHNLPILTKNHQNNNRKQKHKGERREEEKGGEKGIRKQRTTNVLFWMLYLGCGRPPMVFTAVSVVCGGTSEYSYSGLVFAK